MKKVLIIEDLPELQDAWKRRINERYEKEVTLLQALTLKEARQHLSQHKDIDLIALDGTIESDSDGLDILEEALVWHKYTGPILTMSGNEDMRDQMLSSGCTHECEKKFTFQNILRIIGLVK